MPHPIDYPKKVYLNGEILDAEEARISVFDRGFLFGDGIYEVMARIGGRFFRQADHMARMQSCLEKIAIPFDASRLEAEIPALLEASGLAGQDCLLYLQPEWSVREKVTPLIVEYVMANPRWRVSLQTHKYLNIP